MYAVMENNSLPLASKATALDLAEGLGAAEEDGDADDADDGQGLEQVPGAVVEEEDALHGDDGAEEGGVGDGGRAEGLGEVVEVGAEREPLGR